MSETVVNISSVRDDCKVSLVGETVLTISFMIDDSKALLRERQY